METLITWKEAANPDEIYRCPLFKTRPGAGGVDHDWLVVIHKKQPITLPKGADTSKEYCRVTLPNRKTPQGIGL